MRNYNTEIEEADVKILPRSGALVYAADEYRENAQNEMNKLTYLEQRTVNDAMVFDDYRIVPNGYDNNFPYNFKTLLDSVYLGHGIKRTVINLLLSGGVGIYREVKEGEKIIKDWVLDREISDWLDSFEFKESYILEAATDMIYIENCTTQYIFNKGARIGLNPKIAALKFLSSDHVRLEKRDEYGKINNIYLSEWLINNLMYVDIEQIPMFDKNNPFKKRNPAQFIKMPTFGSTYYGRPVDIGAVEMLKVLSLLPKFHKANLTERGFKWIVSVASKYYEAVQSKNQWDRNSKEFKEWKVNFLQSIDDFLIAPEADKLQTRFLTEFAIDPHTGKPINQVQITKLEDDTKTLSEVGMELSDTYTIGYVSANSLHPQLANVNLKNQSLSGSNLREALEMHIRCNTPTMRSLLLTPANNAIKINWPDKNLKLGFMDLAFEDYNKIQSTTKQSETTTKTATV
jgi:hypothetical protein